MQKNIKPCILSGGFGSRLAPITNEIPKPLSPILGKSVLNHLLTMLSKNGFFDAVLTTMYLPELIEAEFGKKFLNLSIEYSKEDKPRGTAGGVKFAMSKYNEDILVMSGDGIFDFDINKAIQFHYEKNADVTIITHKSENPLEFGVVCADLNGKIFKFSEKPPWAQVSSNIINTGIYILSRKVIDLIPDDISFDFSNNLFPLLMSKDFSLYSYTADGFWCDIGDIDEYFNCNMIALESRIKSIDQNGSYSKKELVSLGCNVFSPFWISKTSTIERGATIGSYSIVGDNCILNKGCIVSHSIIHNAVSIGRSTSIYGSIICNNVVLENNCEIKKGCIIGANCKLEEKSILSENIKIGSNINIDKSYKNIFSKQKESLYYNDGFYLGETSSFCSSQSTKFGYFLGKTLLKKAKSKQAISARIGVMHDGQTSSALSATAILCGIKSSSVKSYDFKDGFNCLAGYAALNSLCDLIVFVETDEKNVVFAQVQNRLSLPISREFERSFEAVFNENQSDTPAFIFETGDLSSIKHMYLAELIKSCEDILDEENFYKMSITIEDGSGESTQSAEILKKAVSEMGGSFENGKNTIKITLYRNEPYAIISQNSTVCDYYHMNAIILNDSAKNGTQSFVLPYLSPEIYRKIVNMNNSDIKDYLNYPNSDISFPKNLIASQLYIKDPLIAIMKLLSLLKKENKTLGELLSTIPLFCVYSTTVNKEEKDRRAEIMSKLSENNSGEIESEHEGIRLAFKNGRVTVIPKRAGGFKLISEAQNTEIAKELCFEAQKFLN